MHAVKGLMAIHPTVGVQTAVASGDTLLGVRETSVHRKLDAKPGRGETGTNLYDCVINLMGKTGGDRVKRRNFGVCGDVVDPSLDMDGRKFCGGSVMMVQGR